MRTISMPFSAARKKRHTALSINGCQYPPLQSIVEIETDRLVLFATAVERGSTCQLICEGIGKPYNHVRVELH